MRYIICYLCSLKKTIMEELSFPWGGERRFNSYGRFCNERFGGRVQRIPVDAGFSCPNRESRAEGGCTYCSNQAFSPAYVAKSTGIVGQLRDGRLFFSKHYNSNKGYFAYFQSYTNTFTTASKLSGLCDAALREAGIRGIIISTRPDCLPDSILDFLSELNGKTYLCVEIGIESFSDKTLGHINRGHTVECAFEAFRKLHERKIPTCAHIIFGLPFETPGSWIEEAKLLNALNPEFLKIHHLQIFKGTQIESEYLNNPGRFHVFDSDGYVNFICDYIERLSPNIVIERFCSEVPPRFLSVSHWQLLRHHELVGKIEDELERRNSFQGIRLKNSN